MPSTPTGEVPEKNVPEKNTEVKDNAETPSDPAIQAKADEAALDESDLQAAEDKGKVPYSRFKEKNDETKDLKVQIDELQRSHEAQLKQILTEKQALESIKTEHLPDEEVLDMDPNTKLIQKLQKQVENQDLALSKLQGRTDQQDLYSQLAKLKTQFPDADDLEVLGWKKARPDANISELAELSHTRINDRVKARISEIIADKKAKAKKGTPMQAISYQLKEGEKPKTVKDATRLVQKFLNQI